MNTAANQLQISGKILEIGTEMANEIGNTTWRKQDFVIQTEEKYSKTIHLSVWGDNILWLQRCKVGDLVNAMINVSSKKVGDRWFTEAVAWRIEVDIIRMKTLKELDNLKDSYNFRVKNESPVSVNTPFQFLTLKGEGMATEQRIQT